MTGYHLIHGNFGVDKAILWDTITTDLPELKKQMETIWKDLEFFSLEFGRKRLV